MVTNIYWDCFNFSICPITLFATDKALIRLSMISSPQDKDFADLKKIFGNDAVFSHYCSPLIKQASTQLTEYFSGDRKEFDIPLEFYGTEYQKRVWHRLLDIPFGRTVSYQDIANDLGSIARAVGNANGKNPVAIIVPCHRVVASNGALQGFAGGLDVKEKLLRHEGAAFKPEPGAEPRLF